MTNNPAKFFDDILKLLSTNYRVFKLQEIYKKLFPEDFKQSDEISFEERYEGNNNASEIRRALIFLNSQGLVILNLETDECIISTSGFVKIKTQGFEEEIEEKKINLQLQRWAWKILPKAAIATAIFAGLAFLLSLAKFLFPIFCENS